MPKLNDKDPHSGGTQPPSAAPPGLWIAAAVAIMMSVFGFSVVLLLLGNNVQTAVTWAAAAGLAAAEVAARLLSGVNR